MSPSCRASILTISDSVSSGDREDVSGPTVRKILESEGWEIRSTEILPDDFSLIRERLEALTGNRDLDVVFTTGGTGLGPRDRTPEATTSVMERALPGLAETMRLEGRKKTPLAALSRAVVGVKAKVLLVNLPGAPEGAEDSLRAILGIIPHAVEVIRGSATHGDVPPEPVPVATEEQPEPAPESEPEEPEPEKDEGADAPEAATES